MIYPGHGATKKVETFFVDGIKFDVCELHESHYCYVSQCDKKPRGRFFLAVEDSYIVNYKFSEQYHAQTGDCRYDFFCTSRSDCLDKIKTFEEMYNLILSASPKCEEGRKRLQGRIDFIFNLYGIQAEPANMTAA